MDPGRDDSIDRDGDALSWGDDDPTLDVGTPASEAPPTEAPPAEASVPEPTALPKGYTAVGKDADTVGRIRADGTVVLPGDRPSMGNAALISTGVLGGVYLLYAIGWIIGGLRLQGNAQYLVTDVMFQGSLWLAVLAPVLWFGTVWLVTRASALWVRFAWLAAGAVLLIPWPFIMTGAVGQ